jgi:hypothetical protein
MVNNELERCGRKHFPPDAKYCPGMYLQELKKTFEKYGSAWIFTGSH